MITIEPIEPACPRDVSQVNATPRPSHMTKRLRPFLRKLKELDADDHYGPDKIIRGWVSMGANADRLAELLRAYIGRAALWNVAEMPATSSPIAEMKDLARKHGRLAEQFDVLNSRTRAYRWVDIDEDIGVAQFLRTRSEKLLKRAGRLAAGRGP